MFLALRLGWPLALLMRQIQNQGQNFVLRCSGGRRHKNAEKLASGWHLYYPHGLLDRQILNVALQASKHRCLSLVITTQLKCPCADVATEEMWLAVHGSKQSSAFDGVLMAYASRQCEECLESSN